MSSATPILAASAPPDPEDPDARIAASRLSGSAQVESIEQLQQCRGEGFDDRGAFHRWLAAARLSAAENRWLEAEYLALRAILANPLNTPAFVLLTEALVRNERPEEAETARRYRVPETLIWRYLGPADPTGSDLWRDEPEPVVPSVPTPAPPGTIVHRAFESERVALEPPRTIGTRTIRALSADSTDAPDAATVEITGGSLWFDDFNTVVCDRDGKPLRSLSQGHVELVRHARARVEPTPHGGSVCLLGNRSAFNYYHWMNDVLPRLGVLAASGIALEDIDRFVVQRPTLAFQHETLAHFGITADRIHGPDDGVLVETERLLVPTFGSNAFSLRHGSWVPRFLRREFGSRITAERHRRLYLSRGTTGARGVCNEPELLASLRAYGFERVSSEDLSVREQATLFETAEVVIGPHGAGFTNTAFCRPGTRVIEFYADFITTCFWVQSALLGFEHAVLRTEGAGQIPEGRPNSIRERRMANRLAPIRVNCERVEALLDTLGVSRT